MTDRRRATQPIPVAAWVLVAAAGAQVVLWAALNWYRLLGGPYLILRLEDVSSVITGIAPFLLGAAALLGAARWPAGRRWLHVGVAMSALHGVVQSVTGAWWAWRVTDPVVPEGPAQVALIAASLAQVTAGALVPLCLAAGLFRAGRGRSVSPFDLIVPLAVGAAVLAGGLGVLGRELAFASEAPAGQPPAILLGIAGRLVTTLGALGFVALALAALRAMPVAGMLPEMLIAIGGTLAAAGSAATWIGQSVLSFEAQGEHLLWVFTLPWTATSIGMVLVIVGFGVAALLSPPAPQRTDPAGPAPTGRVGA